MAEKTKIEWTDATWNIITGCSVVSPGCTNCYAMRLAGTRLRNHRSRVDLTTPSKAGPVWNGEVRFNEKWLYQPLQWTKPRMIFVCAHGDLFHESVPDEWIDKVFAVMAMCPQHTFQVLTKRPERMRDYLAGHREPDGRFYAGFRDVLIEGMAQSIYHERTGEDPSMWLAVQLPLKNVWLGFSAEDQTRFDERWEHMKPLAAAGWLVWCSAEPLLGAIDTAAALPNRDDIIHVHHHPDNVPSPQLDTLVGAIKEDFRRRLSLDWMVVGGESGPGARPMHPDWARQIRDDFAAAGVPFHFKQWGAWTPGENTPDPNKRYPTKLWFNREWQDCDDHWSTEKDHGPILYRVGKKAAGRHLDGVIHDAFPEARI